MDEEKKISYCEDEKLNKVLEDSYSHLSVMELIALLEKSINESKDSMETLVKHTEEVVEKNDKMLKCLMYCAERMSALYKMLNHFASGDHLKSWSKTDPQEVLGDIYGRMAPVYLYIVKTLEEVGVTIIDKEKH